MYKPVPQLVQIDKGEDSDSEWIGTSSADIHDQYKSPQQLGSQDVYNSVEEEQLPNEISAFSLARKIALFLSIFNCIAFIIIFLWVLPCDYNTCKSSIILVKNVDWKFQLKSKSIHMMDAAVANYNHQEMLVATTSDPFCPTELSTLNTTRAMFGVRTMDGVLMWEKNITSNIQYLNCSLIDVNGDGVDDCLTFSMNGALSAHNSLTGNILWHFHSHNTNLNNDTTSPQLTKLVNLDSVVDIDNDTVADLVALGMISDFRPIYFLSISGRSGELLWQVSLNANCTVGAETDTIHTIFLHRASCLNLQELESSSQLGIRKLKNLNFVPNPRPDSSLTPESLNRLNISIKENPASRNIVHKDKRGRTFLITATLNCTDGTTLLKKSNI